MNQHFKHFGKTEIIRENRKQNVTIDYLCNDHGQFVDCYRVTLDNGQVIYIDADETFAWIERGAGPTLFSKAFREFIATQKK